MVAVAPHPLPSAYDVEWPDVSDLVIEDNAPVDSIFCEKQQRLLTESLYSSWSGPPEGDEPGPRRFAALANVGVFSSLEEPPVVPDVMVSLDITLPQDQTDKKNRSYFVWRFGKPPDVVIEIVSNREGDELGERLRRYRRMKAPYYVVYDPLRLLGELTLRIHELRGDLYVTRESTWFESVGLGLVEWEGVYEGMSARWLRWCTRDGQLVPTGAERANAAEARAERLAARLRELGIEPNGDS